MIDKRFTVDEGLEDVLCWEINDKENEDMTCGECAKLLNELHEENQKCKEYNAILYSNTAKNEKELLKENEQLKDSVMSWSKSYKRLSEENDGLRIKIRKLRLEKIHQNKENERLRKCINEIYTIARLEEVD